MNYEERPLIMKLKHLPFETKQALKLIKDIKGWKSNNAAVAYCIAVASTQLKNAIMEDLIKNKEEESKDEQ
jgi:hypothetical protein